MNYENVHASDWDTWTEHQGAVILDVREPREWELGTLPNAVLLSMRELPARLEELSRDAPILCVCRSGDRSGQVAAFLAFHGFTAANMVGGMKALGMQP